MLSTSPAQFAAAQLAATASAAILDAASEPPTSSPLERVRDGVWAIGMPMPGHPHSTLSYLILDSAGDLHIVDPGWDSDENWQRLGEAASSIGASTGRRSTGRIATVTVTHLHPDHLGLAERVRANTGAIVGLHLLEQDGIIELRAGVDPADALAMFTEWGAPGSVHQELLEATNRRSAWKGFTADRLLEDGDRLDIPGRDVRVVHTPGHTTGHIALLDSTDSLLFTGDLLLPNQFPGIGLGGTRDANPITEYLASLELISQWDDHEILPGHGYRFTGLAERCAVTAAHHEQRTTEVAEALFAHSGSTVWEIAQGLSWTNGWENLGGFALLSALTQTATHVDRALAV